MDKKRQKRPRDLSQRAKMIVDIAAGEQPDEEPLTATQARAQKAGKKGGPARARALTPEERSKIASVAAQARWKKN